MHFFVYKFPDRENALTSAERFLLHREWAEFVLGRRIINCLLILFCLSTAFALVMVALGRSQIGATSVLMAAIVGYIGRLLNNSFKAIFPGRHQQDPEYLKRGDNNQ